MRMNYRRLEDSDYQETIKKKTIINCEEMQYFQDDELSEADDEEEDEDEGGEERKAGSSSSKMNPKQSRDNQQQPNSASTQLQTQYLKTKSNSEESKGEAIPVVKADPL